MMKRQYFWIFLVGVYFQTLKGEQVGAQKNDVISNYYTTDSSQSYDIYTRLIGGSGSHEGRVEVYHDGSWGTVCSHYWDINDAEVVCRELGFPGALSAPGNAYFGQGTGDIWLTHVNCYGHETSVHDCYNYGWGYYDCGHNEDASVVCDTEVSTTEIATDVTINTEHVTTSSNYPTGENKNTEGTEFVIGFMENYRGYENAQLVIVNSKDNQAAATVTVTSPYGGLYWVISVSSNYLLSLPYNYIRHTGNERSTKGVKVTSTLPVSVYGINGRDGSVDSYLAIPTSVLAKEYFVLTYAVSTYYSQPDSQFLIIGVEDGTSVQLTVTGPVAYNGISYSAGSSFSLTLNALDSVQFQSQGDLTGSKVSSSWPVSVFSGNICDAVPYNVASCDHMVSQIPPLNLWGNSYLTTPLATRTAGDIFRVLASEDGTTVTILGLSSLIILNSGQFHEIDVPSTQSWLITADAPILVAQFCKGGSLDHYNGDPFMMILPSLDNFISGTYDLVTLDIPNLSERYFINVIVDCSVKSQLSSSPPISITWLNVQQHLGLCVGTAELSAGSYSLNHSEEISSQVLVYALGQSTAYGHPLALHFDAKGTAGCDCKNGGTCVENICECPPGYSGSRCEIAYIRSTVVLL